MAFSFKVISENYFSYGLTIYIKPHNFPSKLRGKKPLRSTVLILHTSPLGNHLRTWTAAKASTKPLSNKAKNSRSRLSIPKSNHVKLFSQCRTIDILLFWIKSNLLRVQIKWYRMSEFGNGSGKYHFSIGLADPSTEVPTAQLKQRHQTNNHSQDLSPSHF